MGDDEPFQEEFDEMLDVGALYTNIPDPQHPVDPTEDVDKEAQTNDVVDPVLPPTADIEKGLEIYETSRTVATTFQPTADYSTIVANLPNTTAVDVDPTSTTATAEPNADEERSYPLPPLPST